MNKTIVKVFIVIGILVIALLIWGLVFGGGLAGIYNAVATKINEIWAGITGEDGDQIVTQNWNTEANNLAEANEAGFEGEAWGPEGGE